MLNIRWLQLPKCEDFISFQTTYLWTVDVFKMSPWALGTSDGPFLLSEALMWL